MKILLKKSIGIKNQLDFTYNKLNTQNNYKFRLNVF